MNNFSRVLCLFGLLLMHCDSIEEADIVHITGYWEIESVHSHGETFHPKGGSPVVDFYHLTSNRKGIKKKLHTNFSGIYERSNDKANFKIVQTQEGFYLSYDDALQPWKEKIIKVNRDELILFHSEKEYRYKRHQKVSY